MGTAFTAVVKGPKFKTGVWTFLPNSEKNAHWNAPVVRTTTSGPWSKSTSADGSKGPNGELNSPPEHRGKTEVHTSGLASPALQIAPRVLIDSYETNCEEPGDSGGSKPATISTGTAEPSRL